MIIDLRMLDENSGHLSGTERVAFEDAFGGEDTMPCSVDLDYRSSGGAWYFHGTLAATLETRCHRCLDPVQQPIAGEFDLVVSRRAREHGDDPEPEEDYVTVGVNEHEVSLDRVIHENLVVNIPMLILCSDTCRGLCPNCGANRNHERCDCRPAADPRWEALRKLSHG